MSELFPNDKDLLARVDFGWKEKFWLDSETFLVNNLIRNEDEFDKIKEREIHNILSTFMENKNAQSIDFEEDKSEWEDVPNWP